MQKTCLRRPWKITASTRVARFFLTQFTKRGKYTKIALNYQMPMKYTKWQRYIRNWHRIYQPFLFQRLHKFTQIGIFGLKKYHLATLASTHAEKDAVHALTHNVVPEFFFSFPTETIFTIGSTPRPLKPYVTWLSLEMLYMYVDAY
jgi:hypothetical protein